MLNKTKSRMNRKGDVPTILLFLMAVVLSITSLFAFISFSNQFQGNSIGLYSVQQNIVYAKSYTFSNIVYYAQYAINCKDPSSEICKLSSPKERLQKLASSRHYIYPGTENFFGKLARGEFSFDRIESLSSTVSEKKQGGYRFTMSGLDVSSQISGFKMKRSINYCLEFNDAGEFVQTCPQE